jgi:metal-responsive CopG/Arc/MetJ family transcriptional regulator
MLTKTPENQRSRHRGDVYGKCICVSVPYHELHLIEEMDKLSHMEFCSSRSEYIRKLIRRERNKLREQEKQYATSTWKTMFGDK